VQRELTSQRVSLQRNALTPPMILGDRVNCSR